MQPIATPHTAASLVQREDSRSLSNEHLDTRIQELIKKEKFLEGSLASLPTQSPAAMIHHFNRVNQKLHLTRETPPPEHILPFLQQALKDTHRELYHHQQERIHHPFPLQQLSPELLGLVIEKADPATKASLSQVSKPLLQTTLWVTKTEIATLFSTLLTSLQETLPLLAIHDKSATAKALQDISNIDVEKIRDAKNFADIHQKAMALRNKIATALFLLAKEDMKVAIDLLSDLLHHDNIESNSAKQELEILQKMLEIAMIADDEKRSEQCQNLAQELLQQQDVEGALTLCSIAQDTAVCLYQSQITCDISEVLAEKGDFERALTLTKTIPPLIQTSAYRRIADSILQKEDPTHTFSLFERIIGIAQKDIWSFSIAQSIMKLGDTEGALNLIKTLPDGYEKNLIYKEQATTQPDISIAERLQLSERITDPGIKSWAHSQIYVGLAEEGIETNNQRKIKKALQHIEEVSDPVAKRCAFQDIALIFATYDQEEQAYRIAQKISDVGMRAWTKEKIKQILKGAIS